MYLEFYGLREMPFNITPDPKFLFFTPKHREAFDHLLYGIEQRKGFIELVGEVGAGKTTLCRAVLLSLPRNIETALILNPALSGTQLIRAILNDLGCPPVSSDRLELTEQLNTYLLEKANAGINVAVIIDEAQNLTPEIMEEVRLLSNLETDQHKLMQIILAGQPELETRLAAPSLRQLRQRIMVKCRLVPLNEEETGRYIAHRLRMAGAGEELFFDAAAVKLVYRKTGGVPRLINKLCDRALLAGFAGGTSVIRKPEVRLALTELGDLA